MIRRFPLSIATSTMEPPVRTPPCASVGSIKTCDGAGRGRMRPTRGIHGMDRPGN